MKVVKIEVCKNCLSLDTINKDCMCLHVENYDTIKLDFTIEGYKLADTEYNKEQLKTLQIKNHEG